MTASQKKHGFFILILMVTVCFSEFSEENIPQKIIALEKNLGKVAGDDRVELLNDLAHEYCQIDIQRSLEYANHALELSIRLNNWQGIARSHNLLCKNYMLSGEVEKAKTFAENALHISKEKKDSKNLADALHNIGWYFAHISNYDKALSYHQESLLTYEAINDKPGMASVLNGMGGNYYSTSNYQLALDCYLRSLKIKEELGDKKGAASTLMNIGLIHSALNANQKALEVFIQTMQLQQKLGDKKRLAACMNNIGSIYFKLKDYDQALKYHQNASTLYQEIGYRQGITSSYHSIGKVYAIQNIYALALENFNNALFINEQIGLNAAAASNLYEIAAIFIIQKKFQEAFAVLVKAQKITQESKKDSLVLNNYKSFANLYAAQGNFQKALESHMLYHEKFAQIFNENSSQQINELQIRYDTLKKEKENEQLRKDTKIKELYRNIFIIGFALVTVIMLILFKKYLYLFAFWKKEKFIGGYRLLKIIGAGGMGVVYKAHSIKNKSETAAVKILKEELSGDDSIIKRFKQEAVIIDKCEHPNIVKVFDRGIDHNRLFIAMEYLEGKTLTEVIFNESPIPLGICIHIMEQLADALTLIHSQKIIHRDLKPANIIILSRDGDAHFIKLLDFGLARARFQSTLTKTGELLGTLIYMSPEQLLSKEITVASDIYSLGVIFYEMVCGQRPFAMDNEILTIKQILDEIPAEPVLTRSDISCSLNLLIQNMMDKNPENRPSLGAFQEQLKRISTPSSIT